MFAAAQLPLPQLHLQRAGHGHHQAGLDADHGAGHDDHGAPHDDHPAAPTTTTEAPTTTTESTTTTTSSTTTTSTTVLLPATTPAAADKEPEADLVAGAAILAVLGGMGYGGLRLLCRVGRSRAA